MGNHLLRQNKMYPLPSSSNTNVLTPLLDTMGITAYAANALGDITFVELPTVDDEFVPGDNLGAVESVKAAADIYAPITGKVVAVNEKLEEKPALLANDPEGEGWIAEIKLGDGWETQVEELMDEQRYKTFTEKAKEDEH
jgi:glycine cleavage system H protein